MKLILFLIILLPLMIYGTLTELSFSTEDSEEDRYIELIMDIIIAKSKINKGFNIILLIGLAPDIFFTKVKHTRFSVVILNGNRRGNETKHIVHFHSNFIVIRCVSLEDFEIKLRKAMDSPFWHPHSNIIIDYRNEAEKLIIAKLFYILWYFKAPYAILMHNECREDVLIYNYNAYINEKYGNSVGCWTTKNIGVPVTNRFEKSFRCVESCSKVSAQSHLRVENFGTCLGLNINRLVYGDHEAIRKLNVFEDIGQNLNGFPLRAYSTEMFPFLRIKEGNNGRYSLYARDGFIWNAIAEHMNFTIDLSPGLSGMKKPFNFELLIEQIYSLSLRKADLFLIPVYQFDITTVELDNTFPFQESGVCFISHRADFKTIPFDFMFLSDNYVFILQLTVCLVCIWFIFSLFNTVESGHFNYNQFGMDMLNTARVMLLISVYKPPKIKSFRIFLFISTLCFFLLSFALQGAVISFFASIKRGKEIDTLDDVNEKAHFIEGLVSPDILLLKNEGKFKNINSKLVPIQDILECVKRLNIDNHRMCLVDCSVGRYLERNSLNKGEQYLHIAKDKIHNYYLNMIFPKYSVLTNQFNKYMRMFVESGLIQKWEQSEYYSNMKDNVQIKPLGFEFFKCLLWFHYFLLVITVIVFLLEVISGKRVKHYCCNICNVGI